MPDGRVHSMATILLAGAAGFTTYQLHLLDQPHAIAMACGSMAGLLLTPDLDVDTGCVSDDWARSVVGRGPALFWWLVWRPYSALIPHRSPLSHFPILGTVLRLGYLSLVVWVIASYLVDAWIAREARLKASEQDGLVLREALNDAGKSGDMD